ncbi:hypothetical protein BASA62_003441 [Batrachochytrium salamandrivorans]|nr:hypothetical protein BASA62_003441 [Batrachochytrium salamandrivorans]
MSKSQDLSRNLIVDDQGNETRAKVSACKGENGSASLLVPSYRWLQCGGVRVVAGVKKRVYALHSPSLQTQPIGLLAKRP